MKKFLTVLFTFGFFALLTCISSYTEAEAAHTYPEKYYQNKWCSKWNGNAEYILPDKTRVDCLTKNYAAEFDFAPKWAEAIGQSLYYSKITGKQAAIILIIEKESDFKYFERAKLLANDNNIQLWYMKSPEYNETPARRTTENGTNATAYNTISLNAKEIERMFKTAYKIVNSLL